MELDRSSVILFAAKIGISLIGFIGTVIFAWRLGPSALGIYATFEALISVLTVFSLFGLDSALEKRISQVSPTERGKFLSGAVLLNVIPIAVLLALLTVMRNSVTDFLGVSAFPVLVAGLFVANLSRLLLNTLRGELRIITSGVVELVSEMVRVGTSVFLISTGFGAIALLYGVVAGLTFRSITSIVLVETPFRLPDYDTVRSLIDFSKYAVGANVSVLSYSWTDTILLSLFLAKDAVGVYESAWKLSVVTLIASQSLSTALFPAVSQWNSKKRTAYIENAFSEGLLYAVLLIPPAFVGVVILRDDLMRVIYHFDSGGMILAILVGEKLFQAVGELARKTLAGMDHPDLVFRMSAIMVLGNVLMNIVLIRAFDAVGAAMATGLTSLLVCILGIRYLRRYIRLNIRWRQHGYQALATTVMGAILYAVTRFSALDAVTEVLGTVLIGVVIYSVCILANPGFRSRILKTVGL